MRRRFALGWSVVAAAGVGAVFGPALSAGAITAEETEQTTSVAVMCTYLSSDGVSAPVSSSAPGDALAVNVVVSAHEEFLTPTNDFLASPYLHISYDFLPAIQAAASTVDPGTTAVVASVDEGPAGTEDVRYAEVSLIGASVGGTPGTLFIPFLQTQPTESGGVTFAATDQATQLFDYGENTIQLESFRIPITTVDRSTEGDGSPLIIGTVDCSPASGRPAVIASYVLGAVPVPTTTVTPGPTPAPTSTAPSDPGAGTGSSGQSDRTALADTGDSRDPARAWTASMAVTVAALGIGVTLLGRRSRRPGTPSEH